MKLRLPYIENASLAAILLLLAYPAQSLVIVSKPGSSDSSIYSNITISKARLSRRCPTLPLQCGFREVCVEEDGEAKCFNKRVVVRLSCVNLRCADDLVCRMTRDGPRCVPPESADNPEVWAPKEFCGDQFCTEGEFCDLLASPRRCVPSCRTLFCPESHCMIRNGTAQCEKCTLRCPPGSECKFIGPSVFDSRTGMVPKQQRCQRKVKRVEKTPGKPVPLRFIPYTNGKELTKESEEEEEVSV